MDSPGRAVARLHTVLIPLILVIPTNAMAIEEPKYTVIEKDHDFKVRLYEPTILAETVVDTSTSTKLRTKDSGGWPATSSAVEKCGRRSP